MHVYLKDHFTFLYASFICGLLLSLIYDVFRIIRMFGGGQKSIHIDKHSRFFSCSFFKFYERNNTDKKRSFLFDAFVFIEDILFSMAACVLLLIIIYAFNYGRIRLFSIVAISCGFFVWRAISSRTVFVILEYLIYMIKVLLFYLFFPLHFLIIKIKKMIYKLVLIIYNSLRNKTAYKSNRTEVNKKHIISVNNVCVVKR